MRTLSPPKGHSQKEGDYNPTRVLPQKKGGAESSSLFISQNILGTPEHGQRLGGFELLGFLQLFLCHVLFPPFGLPYCLATQNTMHLACQVCQGVENLASPCRTCRCADAPRRIRQKNGRLDVDLINRPMKYSTGTYCSGHFQGFFPRLDCWSPWARR
jgi:hypothetical protein